MIITHIFVKVHIHSKYLLTYNIRIFKNHVIICRISIIIIHRWMDSTTKTITSTPHLTFGYISNQIIKVHHKDRNKNKWNRHPVTSVDLLNKTCHQVEFAFDLNLNFSSSSPGTLKIHVTLSTDQQSCSTIHKLTEIQQRYCSSNTASQVELAHLW